MADKNESEQHDKDTRKGFWALFQEVTKTPKVDPKANRNTHKKAKTEPKHRKNK